jgi:uncharacterized protein YacL (UPF0231 family)
MKIAAKTARYIKLGKGGCWEDAALARNELHFGYGNVPESIALSLDLKKIKNYQIAAGVNAKAAAQDAREIVDFYGLGPDCIWVTFARGHMWWTFAEPKVISIGGDGKAAGKHIRKCIGAWRNTDVKGGVLRIESLSTKLTKVASYQRTICAVDKEYTLRRINGVLEPVVLKSNQARQALLEALTAAIKLLDWRDFDRPSVRGQ